MSRTREKAELAGLLRSKLNLRLTSFQRTRAHRPLAVPGLRVNPIASTSLLELDSGLFMSTEDFCEVCALPDRVRAVAQLSGAVTYKLSLRDQHRARVGSPVSYLRRTLQGMQTDDSAGKRRRRRRRGVFADAGGSTTGGRSGEDAEYLESVAPTGEAGALDADMHSLASLSSTKTKYDDEIQRFAAADPNNWEISSNNKQQAIYANLHRELRVKGLSRDPLSMLEVKLDVLSPGGNFQAYLRRLRRDAEGYARQLGLTSDAAEVTSKAVLKAPTVQVSMPVPALNMSLLRPGAAAASSAVATKPRSPTRSASLPTLKPVVSRGTRGAARRLARSPSTAGAPPMRLPAGLDSEHRAQYAANRAEIVGACEAFDAQVSAADRRYRRTRRVHRRQLRRQRRDALAQLEPLSRGTTGLSVL